jgi:AcrR family transcriptional regulator
MSVTRRLAAANGFNGTSIRDIALAAGVSTATLYHYASSKEDLFGAAVFEATASHVAVTKELVGAVDDAAIGLRLMVHVQMHIHCAGRPALGIGGYEWQRLGPAWRAQIVATRREQEANLHDVLRRGQSSGLFALVGDVTLAANAIFGMCAHAETWFDADGSLSVHEMSDVFAGYALRMVGATTSVTKAALAAPLPAFTTIDRLYQD